jgi:hypothetical protein
MFGQEFPAAFQERDREKEPAAWNQGAQVLRPEFSLTPLLKAGCAALSRPTALRLWASARRLPADALGRTLVDG